jgi:hypothetical protein
MRCATRSSDDYANAAPASFAGEVRSAIGGAVRGGYVHFVSDAELVERRTCGAHDLQVGIAAHYD